MNGQPSLYWFSFEGVVTFRAFTRRPTGGAPDFVDFQKTGMPPSYIDVSLRPTILMSPATASYYEPRTDPWVAATDRPSPLSLEVVFTVLTPVPEVAETDMAVHGPASGGSARYNSMAMFPP